MRLPVFGLLLWPLAQLSYTSAFAIWETLSVIAIVVFALLWPADRKLSILVCCWSLPVWMTLAEGQDTAFLLLWLALAVLALRKQRPLLAGLLLSLCAAKFHLFLLLPIWIITNRLWRVATGLAVGGSALLLASFVAGGLDWPERYRQLLSDPANNPYPEIMPNLHGVLFGLPHLQSFELIGGAILVALCWLGMSKLDAISGLAPLLIAGLLTAPHAYMADCVLLLPALIILLSRPQNIASEMPCLFLLTPIPYAAIAAGYSLVSFAPLMAILFMLAAARSPERSTRLRAELCPTAAADSPA
jgi:hypothetical protein